MSFVNASKRNLRFRQPPGLWKWSRFVLQVSQSEVVWSLLTWRWGLGFGGVGSELVLMEGARSLNLRGRLVKAIELSLLYKAWG